VNVQPGDLLLTRSASRFGAIIRFGDALRGEPNLSNHVAIVHHQDAKGTTWCLEGRPGGVGWRDASAYLRSPWTMSNVGQPKTPSQRESVCRAALRMIGTAYDWDAIAKDALSALGMPLAAAWNPDGGTVPGHVVCSSLAAYVYSKAGLTCPPGDRLVSPGDWDKLIISHGWQVAARSL
jgi:hypothetical protein